MTTTTSLAKRLRLAGGSATISVIPIRTGYLIVSPTFHEDTTRSAIRVLGLEVTAEDAAGGRSLFSVAAA